jgi:hypothetical protein
VAVTDRAALMQDRGVNPILGRRFDNDPTDNSQPGQRPAQPEKATWHTMVSTARATLPTPDTGALPATAMRRLSQALFAVLQTLAGPRDTWTNPTSASIEDLPGNQYAAALSLRGEHFKLPSELRLVPERIASAPTILAAGFSDPRTASVGVDVARWYAPCSDALDEIAWRRVFTWVVGTDEHLTNLAILEPPAWHDERIVGAYSYDADGVQGYGVLQVAAGADGCWHICDCWGDADAAGRVDALSNFRPGT